MDTNYYAYARCVYEHYAALAYERHKAGRCHEANHYAREALEALRHWRNCGARDV